MVAPCPRHCHCPGCERFPDCTVVSGAKGSITSRSQSHVAFKALLLSVRPDGTTAPITILPNCFIGGGATILPGVTIGPNAIIGAGAVVFEDVPPYAIAVGNPARVIAANPAIGTFGRLPDADANTRQYWQASN